jgi:hypothetical protein
MPNPSLEAVPLTTYWLTKDCAITWGTSEQNHDLLDFYIHSTIFATYLSICIETVMDLKISSFELMYKYIWFVRACVCLCMLSVRAVNFDGFYLGLINYIETKGKCRHLKKFTSKGTLRQVFIRVYRLVIQSDMLVFSTQLCGMLLL